METETTSQPTSWLQRLKEESWEAELLVSAVAIFGSFQLFAAVDWAVFLFIDRLHPEQYHFGYAISFTGLLAISVLASMFVIHFFLRSYWVGLVGLNSVFPDYNIEDSIHSRIFTEKMLTKLPRLKDSISKVDELCSVIFSCAFCILLTYAYVVVMLLLYLLSFNFLVGVLPESLLYVPLYFLALLLVGQSIFSIIANSKKHHNNERLQDIYFKLSYATYLVVQGPLYKSILQIMMIFISNFKKKKSLVLLMVVFFFFGLATSIAKFDHTGLKYLTMSNYFENPTRTFFEYYSDQNEAMSFLIVPEISTDIVTDSVVKIFIPILSKEEKGLNNKFCHEDENLSKFTKGDRPTILQNRLRCLQHYHHVFLDDEKIELDYLRKFHSRTNQSGLMGYLPLGPDDYGNNLITIRKVFDTEPAQEWQIPFYYARPYN